MRWKAIVAATAHLKDVYSTWKHTELLVDSHGDRKNHIRWNIAEGSVRHKRLSSREPVSACAALKRLLHCSLRYVYALIAIEQGLWRAVP